MPADLAPRGFLFAYVRSAALRPSRHTAELNVQMHGASDAAVADAHATPDNPQTCVQLSCALVAWRAPAAMASGATVDVQALAQLLALAACTGRPTPLMAAAIDMATNFRVWVLEGHAITEYRSGPGKSIMALEEGLGALWGLVTTCQDAVPPRTRALQRAVACSRAVVHRAQVPQ
jgi:hypothetical protein